jgi:hypothetical protein
MTSNIFPVIWSRTLARIPALRRWKFGFCAALAMVFIALLPQFSLWSTRGRDWNGSYARFAGDDEYAYSAYVNSLIEGRPRRNDPYTGREEQAGAPQPESLFSIQFLPAYAIALPARVLGISASASFIILTCLATFAASLAIFWFLLEVFKDPKMAAAGAIVVLCLGSLAPLHIFLKLPYKLFDPSISLRGLYVPLGFMRRYLPAAPFPFLFVFCVLVWKAITREKQRSVLALSVAAGIILNLLIFSYFYLWTAAAAWLLCIAFLWAVARPAGWQQTFRSLGIIATVTLAGLIPYAILLLSRAGTMDQTQGLTRNHMPDLFRASEVMGLIVLGALIVGAARGLIIWRESSSLLTAAFALTPLVLFNQQVLTGHSLQPFHYDAFVANYTTLLSAIMAISLVLQKQFKGAAPKIYSRVLWCVVLIAFCWGLLEMHRTYSWQVGLTVYVDEALPVATRMGEIAQLSAEAKQVGRPVVFIRSILLADSLPTFAPQAVLWAPRMIVFSGADTKEVRERYFQYLYYGGTDAAEFKDLVDANSGFARETLFGPARTQPRLSSNYETVTTEEIRQAASDYSNYVASFNRERALRPILSYVISQDVSPSGFTNLDRWYQRDAGERIGRFTLYRVSLRP